MGLGSDETVEYTGFTKYDPEYYEIYEGFYEYKTQYGQEKFIRYCMSIDELN
jgi:hypothetical protein